MNFRELLTRLEEHLGNHQLPVNPAATHIKNIFDGSPLHHDMMTGLVRAIYVANACRRLTDPVNLNQTLQALAPIRQETLRHTATDVDVYRLLDELGAALNVIFADSQIAEKLPSAPTRHTAEIILLAAYRRQRHLKSLA
ncbi:MAG: hypothetical protein ACYC9L_00115 [Sulfuricaulis sp.]